MRKDDLEPVPEQEPTPTASEAALPVLRRSTDRTVAEAQARAVNAVKYRTLTEADKRTLGMKQ